MVARALAVGLAAALVVVPAAAAATALPGGRAIVVTTSISPDTHLFADPVVARVDVVVDPRLLDPDRIRVRLRFAPYERVGGIEERRRAVGELVHIRYTATLRCLHIRCLAPRLKSVLEEQESGRPERHAFHFAPVEVLEGEKVLLRRRFPTVEVVSRINTAQVAEAAGQFSQLRILTEGGAYRASIAPPPPTYRLDPTLLAAVAFAAAFLLFLFPATLGGRLLYARWRAAHRPPPLSPLERALALVEWTARRDDGEEDRRKALEVLADVLEEGGARPLADATRELAWAEESPRGERAHELAARARSTLPGGGNGRTA